MKEIKSIVRNGNAACQVVYTDHIGKHYVIPNQQMTELRQGKPK